MASTTFQDYNQNTPIVASWLNDVNAEVYTPTGIPKKQGIDVETHSATLLKNGGYYV
jgi:hypothetical protein